MSQAHSDPKQQAENEQAIRNQLIANGVIRPGMVVDNTPPQNEKQAEQPTESCVSR